MSCEYAIKVENLTKIFHIYDSPRDRLLQMLSRGKKQYFREFWALRDVSFTIAKGETVGIIGRNGSGKSTLLQIICGTLAPTLGSVDTKGRVAALLELGSGFNPDFTGRENVYMNAAVLGLSKEETDSRFPEIESFAEIGDFIDQPVKSYSSGMLVRLAFAVAINVDPQILIVDEALSVGDELFQRKCFARIEAIKTAGATILFVSHSGSTIVELCDRAILLDHGDKLLEGAPKNVIGKYQKLLYAPAHKLEHIRAEITDISNPTDSNNSGHPKSTAGAVITPVESIEEFFDPHLKSQSMLSYESHGAVIHSPMITNIGGLQVNCLKNGDTYRYSYKVDFFASASNVRFGMMIKTVSGVELGGSTSAAHLQDAVAHIIEGTSTEVEFSFDCNLNPGTYYLNAGVVGSTLNEDTYLHRLLDACLFRVLPTSRQTSTGTIDFNCTANISEH